MHALEPYKRHIHEHKDEQRLEWSKKCDDSRACKTDLMQSVYIKYANQSDFPIKNSLIFA